MSNNYDFSVVIPIFNESEVPRSLEDITDKTEIISILEIQLKKLVKKMILK